MNNLTYVRTARGGIAPAMLFEKSVLPKVEKFLTGDLEEYHRNPTRCVFPEHDDAMSEPLRKITLSGYKTVAGACLALFTGWHFIFGYPEKAIYIANSKGLRLIADHGCPHKAYASMHA